MDKINNKNAREKALLEEAYGSVYNEGQFWGRDDLVKKGKEEDKARGAVKLVGKTKGGNYTSATLPKGDPKIKELEAQGYKRVPIEDEQNPDADTWGGGMKGPFEDIDEGPENEEGASTAFSEEGRHRTGFKMAQEGLQKMEKALETVDVRDQLDELSRAYNHLSIGLQNILNHLDEDQREWVRGGRADQQAAREVDFRPADGREW